MKIGVLLAMFNPLATPAYVTAVGRACDEAGFDSLWAPEHVVLFGEGEQESEYPYDTETGRFPIGGESGLIDPFILLPFIAAVTERIPIGTGITLVPQRNPVYTAKMVSDLDVLTGGRFLFGVGVGWQKEEFEVLNMPFEGRGAVCREYLEVMKRLWQDPVSQYEGEHYKMRACRQYPKPVQKPHPPIYFGGESNPALRRVADLGQGWFGFNLLPDETAERVSKLSSLLVERNRDRSEVDFAVSPYMKPVTFDDIERYAEIGIDHVILVAGGETTDDTLRTVDELARTMLEPAQRL
jgi:probable F420-dependent oxidoreductase